MIAPMMPDTSKVEMQVMIATLTVLTLLAICLYGLFSVSLTFSKYVDDALSEMKDVLKQNSAIASIVEPKEGEK